ncbi:MAG TPA: ATP-binding protein, partial [Burkholderiales bacterium]|nr:ATP-binding protein [Burkholderiales bacterium]
ESTDCLACRDINELVRELERGAAAILIAEEAYVMHGNQLAATISRQPHWSDLPVLLLTRRGADSSAVLSALETLGNVTLLERPIRVAALMSCVRTAIRARGRQYRTRAYLEDRDEADRRKDQFLATLAHELRNPLAPIRTSLDILRMAQMPPLAADACSIMERQMTHLVRLVDDLMEVSRITRGKIELRVETVDLASVIASAVETSRPLIDAGRHKLSVSLPGEPLMIEGDPVRLSQVFSNLLNNSARYTDPGGRISIEAWRADGSIVITVRDTGVGIRPEALPRVFEMFAQAHATDVRAQTGLGIGLTIVRSLVELHGGSVSAESEGPGRGSRFSVRLPLAARGGTAAVVPISHAARFRKQRRVLLVDDNRDAADSLRVLLQTRGAEVRVAYDGASALEALEHFRADVAILDLGLPGMDGFEVARRIRERTGGSCSLIALTGWGQEEDRRQTEAAGFSHHLVKPVSIEALQATLESLDK